MWFDPTAYRPVTDVRLSDRVPGQGDLPRFFWQRQSVNHSLWSEGYVVRRSYAVPDEIFDLLPSKEDTCARTKVFETAPLAHLALSDAAVTYGRRLAKLPDLPLPRELEDRRE